MAYAWQSYILMKMAIAVFVKTPGLSEFKTRLRKDFGDRNTNEFYLKCIRSNVELLQNLKEQLSLAVDIYWAVSEIKGIENPIWDDFCKLYQGDGNLGERLSSVYMQLIDDYNIVFFIGSDTPHLKLNDLIFSINSFIKAKSDFLISPSRDGGFYLFGGKKAVAKDLWTSVSYSKNSTFEELISKLRGGGGDVLVGELNFDIDSYHDLHDLLQLKTDGLLFEQLKLIQWIRTQI